MLIKKFAFLLLCTFFLIACQEKYTPKPRGYYRIDFPPKSYNSLSESHPFTFEIPQYAEIEKDVRNKGNKHWFNVNIPANNAQIHISYYPLGLNSQFQLSELIEESRRLAYKHSIKADAIHEKQFQNDQKNVHGIVYQISGNAASPLQYFLTDSTNHFLRGALYIREVPNIDSIQPVIQFLEEDVVRMIETTNWK